MRERDLPLWPLDNDALILRAVLLDADEALGAWREWKQAVDYTTLDFTQRRLIPLLHNRLRQLEVCDPMLAHYRNDTRIFWIKNQELLKFASTEIRGLAERGIETLALKGVPLAKQYYAGTGLRPMSDVDVLVRPVQAQESIDYFLRRGWSCSDEFIMSLDNLEQIVAVRNGLNMRDPASGREIDLHWRLLKNSLIDVEPMWDAAQPFELNGETLQTLCQTDHLLHACTQAADWNIVRPIRWMPDAVTIIRHGGIDWERLVTQAQRMEIVEAVRDALCVLEKFAGVTIPEEPLLRLRASATTLLARMDYRASARAPTTLIGKPLLRFLRYLRIGAPQGLRFDQYLRYMWGTSSLARAFAYGIGLLWKDTFGSKTQ